MAFSAIYSMNFKKLFKKPNSDPQYIKFVDRLSAAGYNFRVVYDIGAFKAEWSLYFKQRYPKTEFILFEANPAHESELLRSGLTYFTAVLSDLQGRSVNFYAGADSGDSYYKETTTHYDTKNFLRVETDTLDGLMNRERLSKPNFVKIDTQGSELDILRGGTCVMLYADFFYVECPIIEYNRGAPKISDYLEFFRSFEFVPTDILEIHRSENILIQVDIMFVRRRVLERYLGKLRAIRPW